MNTDFDPNLVKTLDAWNPSLETTAPPVIEADFAKQLIRHAEKANDVLNAVGKYLVQRVR